MEKDRRAVGAGGADRFFLLTTPAAHDGHTPLPLVLDFHGLMEGAEIHATMTGFSPLAQREGFVVAFPHGSGNPVKWDVNADTAASVDLPYFDAMLAQLKRDLCIDESRIYGTGLSFGAIMTSYLLCQRGDVFAAAAPVDGITLPNPCPSSRKVPILAFHGTADPILPFNGGLGAGVGSLLGGKVPEAGTPTTLPPYDLEGEGYPKTMRGWAERNGCAATPVDTAVSKEVLRRVYACPTGSDVEFVVILGGGHTWSGSEFSKSIGTIVGHTTFEIDASAEIWKFVSRFQRAA